MTTPISEIIDSSPEFEVVAGVDTHADTHHVAVLSVTGARLGDLQVPATTGGYDVNGQRDFPVGGQVISPSADS